MLFLLGEQGCHPWRSELNLARPALTTAKPVKADKLQAKLESLAFFCYLCPTMRRLLYIFAIIAMLAASGGCARRSADPRLTEIAAMVADSPAVAIDRSEEHTSELQSR